MRLLLWRILVLWLWLRRQQLCGIIGSTHNGQSVGFVRQQLIIVRTVDGTRVVAERRRRRPKRRIGHHHWRQWRQRVAPHLAHGSAATGTGWPLDVARRRQQPGSLRSDHWRRLEQSTDIGLVSNFLHNVVVVVVSAIIEPVIIFVHEQATREEPLKAERESSAATVESEHLRRPATGSIAERSHEHDNRGARIRDDQSGR